MYVGLSQKNAKFLNVPKATNGVWTVLSKSFEFRGGAYSIHFYSFLEMLSIASESLKGSHLVS